MARLTSRNFTKAEADAFVAASNQPHTVQWKASAYRLVAGVANLLLDDLPIVAGRLTLDSSDPTRRRLTLEVGGGDEFVPTTTDDPLVPFGQAIYLWTRIDLPDGSWSPWLKQGEFPITSYVYERPTTVATVDAADYSLAVDEFLHLTKRGYGNRTVQGAIVEMVNQALPDKVFTVVAHPDAATKRVTNFVADAGQGRWDSATSLAQVKGFEVFFDAAGNLVIRPDVTDDNDNVIPGVGPDIGTVENPVAVIADGEAGNLVAMTATLTREGGCNGVIINIHETADQKAKGKKAVAARGDERRNVQVSALQSTGPAAWGDRFGRLPIVNERNVATITNQVVADQQSAARRLLHRRRGIVRYIDLDAAGLYWVEPDDKVAIKWGNRTEYHYVQRVEFDLSGRSPVRIRTRQLAVTDPGGLS